MTAAGSVGLVQPSLPEFDPRTVRRQRKQVRAVSRGNYQVLRDTGVLDARTHAVLTALAHLYYVTQTWPTPAELMDWMFRHGQIPRPATNIIGPRVSDLVNGRVRRRRGQEPTRDTRTICCEYLPKRSCRITGGLAHPVRILEAGSLLPRLGYGGLF